MKMMRGGQNFLLAVFLVTAVIIVVPITVVTSLQNTRPDMTTVSRILVLEEQAQNTSDTFSGLQEEIAMANEKIQMQQNEIGVLLDSIANRAELITVSVGGTVAGGIDTYLDVPFSIVESNAIFGDWTGTSEFTANQTGLYSLGMNFRGVFDVAGSSIILRLRIFKASDPVLDTFSRDHTSALRTFFVGITFKVRIEESDLPARFQFQYQATGMNVFDVESSTIAWIQRVD